MNTEIDSKSEPVIFSPEAQKIIDNLNKQIQEHKDKEKEILQNYENSKAEIAKRLEAEKESIKEEAKKIVLQQIKEEKEKADLAIQASQDQIKQKIITKILKFDESTDRESLQKMSLDTIKAYYLKVIKTSVSEGKKRFSVTCPIKSCRMNLGRTTTRKEAEKLFKDHKKEHHGDTASTIAKVVLFSLLLAAVGGIAMSVTKKRGKKNAS